MPKADDAHAKKPTPVDAKGWENQAPPPTHVKKSPRLERREQIRLPEQPGQALDLNDPGIDEALDDTDPGLSHERLGHGHKEAGARPGHGDNY